MKNRQAAFSLSASRGRVRWVTGNPSIHGLVSRPGTENGYEHYPIDMYLISGIWHLWRQSNLFDSVVPDDTAAHAAPTFIRYGGRIAAGALSIGL
jgi:hypothetical protein